MAVTRAQRKRPPPAGGRDRERAPAGPSSALPLRAGLRAANFSGGTTVGRLRGRENSPVRLFGCLPSRQDRQGGFPPNACLFSGTLQRCSQALHSATFGVIIALMISSCRLKLSSWRLRPSALRLGGMARLGRHCSRSCRGYGRGLAAAAAPGCRRRKRSQGGRRGGDNRRSFGAYEKAETHVDGRDVVVDQRHVIPLRVGEHPALGALDLPRTATWRPGAVSPRIGADLDSLMSRR